MDAGGAFTFKNHSLTENETEGRISFEVVSEFEMPAISAVAFSFDQRKAPMPTVPASTSPPTSTAQPTASSALTAGESTQDPTASPPITPPSRQASSSAGVASEAAVIIVGSEVAAAVGLVVLFYLRRSREVSEV